jgi:hypothetical protein
VANNLVVTVDVSARVCQASGMATTHSQLADALAQSLTRLRPSEAHDVTAVSLLVAELEYVEEQRTERMLERRIFGDN